MIENGCGQRSESPEKCFVPSSLASKFFVDVLLPPLTGLFIVAAISIPWHYTGFSWGLRFCCEHKRSLADAPLKKRHAKKLVTKWGGEPVLDGT